MENVSLVECRADDSIFEGIAARAAVFRDCALKRAHLKGAYLYRAMITGDPPSGMSLNACDLRKANLVQAYIAADLSNSDLRGANCAYARLNQSDLRWAKMGSVIDYLKDLFTRLPAAKITQIKQFTPAMWVRAKTGASLPAEENLP
jgi:uncharacterized protein YjbI with pentapeptide repeats